MAESRMFRSALFGGFNKDDVNEYIKTLENEIEAIKVLHQKEKNDLLRQLDQREEEKSEGSMQLPRLQEELASAREELEIARFAKGDAEKELVSVKAEFEAAQSELTSVKTEFETAQVELASVKAEFEAAQSELASVKTELAEAQKGEPAPQPTVNDSSAPMSDNVVFAERERLRMREAELDRREKELEERRKVKEEGFVDYGTISAVLKDARNTAAIIEEDARKKADEILEKAKQDAENYKKEQEGKINAELETKGIQLFAAKHKISQCANEVKRLQESLFNVYVGIDSMASSMPTRLDHYWAGETYRELTELQNEKNGENEETNSAGDGGNPEENPEENPDRESNAEQQ